MLSDLDQVVRLFHTQTIYVYNAKHNALVEHIRNSLSKILCYYYPVAGRLRKLEEGGRLELNCNAKGAVLIEAKSTKTVHDYGDFMGDSAKDLVPKVDYTNTPIEELPLLVVQVTSFLGDDAFSIGVALSHTFSDGVASIQFINSWAKLARGDTLESHEMPFLDRTVLKFTDLPSPPRFKHQEFKPLPLILGRSDTTVEKNKRVNAISLKLTAEQVGKLKNKANADGSTKGSKPYSRFEAIGAQVWRCASKARGLLDENQRICFGSLLMFAVDLFHLSLGITLEMLCPQYQHHHTLGNSYHLLWVMLLRK